MKSHRPATVLAALAIAALPLTGCAAIDELAHKRRSTHFDDAAAMKRDWHLDAPWVPADGRDIRIIESTVASDASLLVDSDTPLDESLCAAVPRQSTPSYTVTGAPDAFEADDVFACGAWSVLPSANGWFGWTPNHPEEQAQSLEQ